MPNFDIKKGREKEGEKRGGEEEKKGGKGERRGGGKKGEKGRRKREREGGRGREGRGICTYVRPQLTCDNLFDQLIRAGKRVAIIAMTDSTFLHIFAGRELDYFETRNAVETQEKALELIATDQYDVISIHTFEYDDAAHAYGPESKEGLNAISIEAEGFDRIAEALRAFRDKHRILLTYSPDHGQHLVFGGRSASFHGRRTKRKIS